MDALAAKIDGMIPWKYGAFGTIGANWARYENWFSRGEANTEAFTIGLTANAFANLHRIAFHYP